MLDQLAVQIIGDGQVAFARSHFDIRMNGAVKIDDDHGNLWASYNGGISKFILAEDALRVDIK